MASTPRRAKKRARGEGLIRKRSDGRWEGRISMGRDVGGKMITRSVYAPTKAEASEKLLKLRVALGAGGLHAEQVSLRFWLEACIDARRDELSENSVARLRGYVPHLRELWDIPISEIRTDQLESLYLALSKRLSKSSLTHIRAFIRAAYKRAMRHQLAATNPAEAADIPRMEAPERGYVFPPNEIEALLLAATGSRIYPMIYTGLTLGLRPGEILGLRWEDFNDANGSIHIRRIVTDVNGRPTVRPVKTKKSNRILYLSDDLLAIFRDLAVEREYDWIFPSEVGTPIAPHNFKRDWKRVLAKAGLDATRRLYDLRHTALTRLIEITGDPKLVATIAGHSTMATTMSIYQHIGDAAMRRAGAISVVTTKRPLLGQ